MLAVCKSRVVCLYVLTLQCALCALAAPISTWTMSEFSTFVPTKATEPTTSSTVETEDTRIVSSHPQTNSDQTGVVVLSDPGYTVVPSGASQCSGVTSLFMQNLKCGHLREKSLKEILQSIKTYHHLAKIQISNIETDFKQRSYTPSESQFPLNIPSLNKTDNSSILLEEFQGNLMLLYTYTSMIESWENSRDKIIESGTGQKIGDLNVIIRDGICSLSSHLGTENTSVDTSSLSCLKDITTVAIYQEAAVGVFNVLLQNMKLVLMYGDSL